MKLIGVLVLLGILAGCDRSQPISLTVAKVGKSTLYKNEVDYRLQHFSEGARQQILQNKSRYAEFVESVAYAKLMANKQWAELSEDQQNMIALQVEAYRTDLLSRKYLEANLPMRQPSSLQIEEYYHAHPELFSTKEYQVQVVSIREGCSIAPELLVKRLDEAQFNLLMKSECSILEGNKDYSQAELEQFVTSPQGITERHAYWTQVDHLARLFFVEKIIAETKSLPEVANGIRETLAAKNFKEAFDAHRFSLSKEIELLN